MFFLHPKDQEENSKELGKAFAYAFYAKIKDRYPTWKKIYYGFMNTAGSDFYAWRQSVIDDWSGKTEERRLKQERKAAERAAKKTKEIRAAEDDGLNSEEEKSRVVN